MPIKSVKMKISKNKKMRFFLMSQGSLDPKIRFIGQKVCSVARVQTDRHTDRQTHRQTRKWIQRTPFQVFRIFQIFHQPIIKELSNKKHIHYIWIILGKLESVKTRHICIYMGMECFLRKLWALHKYCV